MRPLFISEPCQRVVGPGMAQRVQATWQVVHLEACIESRRSGPAAPVIGVDNMGSGDSWPSRGRTDGTTLRLLGQKLKAAQSQSSQMHFVPALLCKMQLDAMQQQVHFEEPPPALQKVLALHAYLTCPHKSHAEL